MKFAMHETASQIISDDDWEFFTTVSMQVAALCFNQILLVVQQILANSLCRLMYHPLCDYICMYTPFNAHTDLLAKSTTDGTVPLHYATT